VGTVTLDRPERKNPLTFASYAELTSFFRSLVHAVDVKVVIITGAGENFCSGGDVHEIIGPLVEAKNGGRTADLLAFTRMTGGLVAAMRACPQPIVAAVDGVCAGAGAILAMASDLRLATARARTAFLFVRVGLSGADMGACALLPRIIGQGRAAELLYTGRFMSAEEGERWGFFNRLVTPRVVAAGGTGAGARHRRRAHGGARRHQGVPARRMGHVHRRGHRARSAGAGGVHDHQRLRACLSGLREARGPALRGELMGAHAALRTSNP
jgi:enoyl-CoA hydratase/carnithine racemase